MNNPSKIIDREIIFLYDHERRTVISEISVTFVKLYVAYRKRGIYVLATALCSFMLSRGAKIAGFAKIVRLGPSKVTLSIPATELCAVKN